MTWRAVYVALLYGLFVFAMGFTLVALAAVVFG